ncbi:MAG: 50S ribosomal protein L22 [Patescibacteria group bacterium]|nr:50S ribosomal protein L22 [Patescibacteria group bacterium]
MSPLVHAKLRYLHIAPRKARLVANAIKGMTVNEAEAQLMFRAKRASEPILKLLRSAVANAKNNYKLDPETLFVKAIRVDQGPMLKRFLPRAMGRATPIHKKMSHVWITLESKEKPKKESRFLIAEKAKKVKKESAKKRKAEMKPAAERETPTPSKTNEKGFLKKMFNRKSV